MSGGGSNGPAYPSVLPAFESDIGNLKAFAMNQGGQTLAPGAFTPTSATLGAANFGNAFFQPGGAGSTGAGYLNDVLSGKYLTPDSNPYLQGNITALQHAFNQTLGSGMDRLNSQFTGLGQDPSSGPRQNASAQFARGAMSDFTDSLSSLLYGNYSAERGMQQQGLSMLDQPLSAAGMSSALSQQPGQMAYQGQLAQNQLSQIPFNLMLQLMQATPVSYPAYGPEQTPWYDYLLQGVGQGAGPALAAAFA